MAVVSLVFAVAANRVIGKAGGLPWRLRDDMAYFQRVTMGKPVVMGRKTFESIPEKFRPLPGRRNVVVTRNAAWRVKGVEVVGSLEEAFALLAAEEEVMVIGGGEIYAAAMERAGRLYVTEVGADVDGDVFFPEYDRNMWHEVSRAHHLEGEWNYDWVVYEK
jgi:dihydrofolate reductase